MILAALFSKLWGARSQRAGREENHLGTVLSANWPVFSVDNDRIFIFGMNLTF